MFLTLKKYFVLPILTICVSNACELSSALQLLRLPVDAAFLPYLSQHNGNFASAVQPFACMLASWKKSGFEGV